MKDWKRPGYTHVFIFNVGRGLSVFMRDPNNYGYIFDVGDSKDFSPLEFISENLMPNIKDYDDDNKLAQLIITHPHADHISEIEDLEDKIGSYGLVTCPHDKSEKEAVDWDRINNPDGNSNKIECYKALYKKRYLPLQSIDFKSPRSIADCEYGVYYVRPPEVDKVFDKNDQEYANGISVNFYYRQKGHSILIPGDINPDCTELLLNDDSKTEKRFTSFERGQAKENWHKATLDQPSLGDCLEQNGLTFYLTPHHGLESGFCQKVYDTVKGNKVGLHLISEKRHTGENDGAVHQNYQSSDYAEGIPVDFDDNSEERKSLSTRNGEHILLRFSGVGEPEVFARKNPEDLLDICF